MAIQPIDLQTLFTQVDKVARQQSAQREGHAMQQALQGVHLQRKLEEQIQAVNETQNIGEDGAEKVKDRQSQGDLQEQGGGDGKKKEQENSAQEEKPIRFFSDPRLGRNIDIST